MKSKKSSRPKTRRLAKRGTTGGELLDKINKGVALTPEEREFAERWARIGEPLLRQVSVGLRLMASAHEDAYQLTHNPLFAWEAYRCHRKLGGPIPAWILDYLDRLAGGMLQAHAQSRGALSARGLAELLTETGSKGRGGVARIFEQYARFQRDCELADRVERLIEGGCRRPEAWRLVANPTPGHPRSGFSESTVRRAWERYGPYLRKELPHLR
jgi:hypothetical protein